MKQHSSTNFPPYEIYHQIKVDDNPLPHTIKLIEGIPGRKLTENEINEMNRKAMQSQQNRAKRNYSLRWSKYKASIKEKLIVEGQLVLVKPVIESTFNSNKKTNIFHACAKVYKVFPGTDYCKLEWITDGPTKTDKPGTISKNWLISSLTKIKEGTNEEQIIENMKIYSSWNRNYEINDILGKLIDSKTNTIYYLIQWEGYTKEESSWVKENNITNIDTIEKYIIEYQIPVKNFIYNSIQHFNFTESLCSNTDSTEIFKHKEYSIFTRTLKQNQNSQIISNFSIFNLSNINNTNSNTLKNYPILLSKEKIIKSITSKTLISSNLINFFKFYNFFFRK
jgi:hypothetical protein